MLNILEFVHYSLAEVIETGDTVLDGTAGNGHDTLFLAQTVGAGGQVYAVDISPQAIENTRKILEKSALLCRVRLICGSHADAENFPKTPIAAAVFNLGYLPGGDKSRCTQPQSSVQALANALKILKKGGRTAVALYRGHSGGKEEAAAVENWAQTLPQQAFQVLRYQFANRSADAPYALIIEKR